MYPVILALIVVIIIIILVVLFVFYPDKLGLKTTIPAAPVVDSAGNPTGQIAVPVVTKTILPRTDKIKDCGYGSMTRGWYDMQTQGVKNDYCRWVGDGVNKWFSCQLAGSTNAISPNTVKYNDTDAHDPLVAGTYGC